MSSNVISSQVGSGPPDWLTSASVRQESVARRRNELGIDQQHDVTKRDLVRISTQAVGVTDTDGTASHQNSASSQSVVGTGKGDLERTLGGKVRGPSEARCISIPRGVDRNSTAVLGAVSSQIRAMDQARAGAVEFGDKSIAVASTGHRSLKWVLGGEVCGFDLTR